MGALSDRLAEAKRAAAEDPGNPANLYPVNQHHDRLACALYAAMVGAPIDRVAVKVTSPAVGAYQAEVTYSFGGRDWYSDRGSIENSPYMAAVKLVDRLIGQYQRLDH